MNSAFAWTRPPLASRARIAAVITQHSRSFALASRLLPAAVRADAVLLYACCRKIDDAIDCVAPAEQPRALATLRAELAGVYAGRAQRDELQGAVQELVRAREIPQLYFEELLLGMEMDVRGARYRTLHDLLRYAYRVAGTVGLMMCHTLGVRHERALIHAAHLGIAMQLTNIARDVAEDWARGRLYLPAELLARHGAAQLVVELGKPLPPSAAPAIAGAVRDLLDVAAAYYRSADLGLRDLPARSALGVRVARLLYAEIGAVLRARACDPLAPRAVVGGPRKLWLVLRALVATVWSLPRVPWALRPRVPRLVLACAAALGLATAQAQPAPAPAPAREPTGRVVVQAQGVASSKGQLIVLLFRSETGFPDQPKRAFARLARPARAGTQLLTFERVPAGAFALSVLHDEDGDFALDTGFLGRPTEGFGFSRNAMDAFSPPEFDECRLVLRAGTQLRVPIKLRY